MKIFLRVSTVIGIIAALIGGYFLLNEQTTIGLILTLGGLYIAAFPEDIVYPILFGIGAFLYDILGFSMTSVVHIILGIVVLFLILSFCWALSRKLKTMK